ncbi:helix-turn-helix domain-containing protein [Streptomyces justiciae]|uniref:helix-turn-helix domain-containing protein n=1 Tax=Streptomyces justiciae TaxID=2780140 RepID=UPI002118A086|nr:hypothetical protein [Streptomyces justiciae]MCW8382418.1 hypothetical protein [Streptomyces justiciae]
MSETTNREEEPPGAGLARGGRGRPRKALAASMPPAQQEFADVLREQVCDPLRVADWPLERISRRLGGEGRAAFSAPTLSRIASGQRIPSAEVLEAILDLVGEVAQQPVPRQARQDLERLRLAALAVAAPGRYRQEIVLIDNRQLRAERDRLHHRHTDTAHTAVGAGPEDGAVDDHGEESPELSEQAGMEALPPPVRDLRADTVAHVDDVIAAGVALPARIMPDEPQPPVTTLGVLQEIDDVLQHAARALSRALATDPHDQPADHTTTPVPPAAPAVIGPAYDEPAWPHGERAGCAPAVGGLLTVAVLVLAYLYLLPLLKDRQEQGASPTASATVTATATRDPQPPAHRAPG